MQPLTVHFQRYWLFLFIFLIPFSTWYLVQAPFAISLINVFSVVFIGLGIYNLTTGKLPKIYVPDKATLVIIGLLFVAISFGLLNSHPLRSGLGFWISRLVQPMLVGFFVLQMAENKTLKPDELIKVLFWSLLPLVIVGALQLIHVVPLRDPLRISAAYRWPDTFGRYVEILVLLSAPWVFLRSKIIVWQSALWLAGLGIMVASFSYSVVASCVVALLCIVALLPKSYAKLKLVVAGTAMVGAVLAVSFSHQLLSWHYGITASKNTRLEFWQVAERTIAQHPLTGIGLKGWQQQYPQLVAQYGPNHPPLNVTSEQPQNVFLDSLLKAGVLGLVAVTAVLVWPIVQGIRLSKLPFEAGGRFGLGLAGYGIGLLLFGLLDDPLWSDDTAPLLFIVVLLASWFYSRKPVNA